MSEQARHLDDSTFQSYLEAELDHARRFEVEAHLSSCARCSAQLDGWRLLLEELGELPVLEPSQDLPEHVLARMRPMESTNRTLWSRVRSTLQLPSRWASRHPTSEALQDLLDGALESPAAGRLQAHLAECEGCRAEWRTWERLYASIEAIERLRPSPGFAEAVMREFHDRAEPAPAPPLSARVLAAAGSLLPSTRRRWALACALVLSPAVGMIALATAVFLHPLVTVRDSVLFAAWRFTEAFQAGFARVLQLLVETAIATQGLALVQSLLSSPGLALGALLAIWSTVAAAAWILYRNVVAPNFIASRHG